MGRRAVAWILAGLCLPASAGADDSAKRVEVVVTAGTPASAPPPMVVVTPVPAAPAAAPRPWPGRRIVLPATAAAVPVPACDCDCPCAEMPVEAPPEDDEIEVVLTVNPLFLWFGNLRLEGALASWISLLGQVDFQYLKVDESALYLYGITAGANVYPGGEAPEGFYLGLRAGWDRMGTENDGDSTWESDFVRLGGAIGGQWVWGSFAFGIGGGVFYGFGIGEEDDDLIAYEGGDCEYGGCDESGTEFPAGMVLPFLELQIGWGF